MDLKHITAHSGRIITRDLFTQPYSFLNVFFNCLGYWLLFCMCLFLEKKKKTVIPKKTVITITTNETKCYLSGNMQF